MWKIIVINSIKGFMLGLLIACGLAVTASSCGTPSAESNSQEVEVSGPTDTAQEEPAPSVPEPQVLAVHYYSTYDFTVEYQFQDGTRCVVTYVSSHRPEQDCDFSHPTTQTKPQPESSPPAASGLTFTG